MVTLGVLTVVVKHRCLNQGVAHPCPANSLLFAAHSYLSKSSKCISTLQACKIWLAGAGACRDYALVLVPRTLSMMIVAGARETSCFGGATSTFRDRCKGSERLYFERQISCQVQLLGHGGALRRALIS